MTQSVLRHARGLEASLEPGDVLFLPRYFWHCVHQLDEGCENLTLNFWVGDKDAQGMRRHMQRAQANLRGDEPQAPARLLPRKIGLISTVHIGLVQDIKLVRTDTTQRS